MIDPEHRHDLVRTLTTAGFLSIAAWAFFLLRQIQQVARVTPQRFGGLWDQRIEVMSFVVLPPNSLLIVPAALCAVTATWLAGAQQEIDQAILLRIVRWGANLLGLLALVSTINIIVNDGGSPTRLGDMGLRLSGLLTAAAVSLVCRTTERSSPTG